MNYPEYVLRRSKALWRELEEAWQQELITATGVMRKHGTETEAAEEKTVEAESTRGENVMEESAEGENVKGVRTKEESAKGENVKEENVKGARAVKRLAEKLFPAGSEDSAETMQRFTAQARETRGLAGFSGASDARRESDSARWLTEVSGVNSILGGGGSARWLVDELGRGTTEGIAPERVRERTADFAPVYETADLQTLSQSVERDARRYDGGFLLY